MGIAAELIRQARQDAGLTMAELAVRAGTSKPTVSRYENGVVDPGVETLNRLLAACGRELQAHAVESLVDADDGEPSLTDERSAAAERRELRTASQVADFFNELRGNGLLD